MVFVADVSDSFRLANCIEGCFWIALAAGFLIYGLARRRIGPAALPAVTLALFGCSDFVEMSTGAWWRPWWLLAWKTGCVVVLVAILWRHYRARQRPRAG